MTIPNKINWYTVVPIVVGLSGLAFEINKTNTQTHERISKLEGIVEQLGKTVDSHNTLLLQHGRVQVDNIKRIDRNEKSVAVVKEKIVKTQQVLKEVKAQQN